ncbi:MAG: hypothetical protein RLZ81_1713 [Pseudomonadota bacterium]|jgi:hypothetical protein
MNDGKQQAAAAAVAKNATAGEGEAYADRMLEAPVADEQGVTGLGKVASKLTKKGKSNAA